MLNNRTGKAEWAIRWYSRAIIAFCLLGVAYVHVPHLLWKTDWTLFKLFGWPGSYIIHFFEVPVILMNLYVSYYGLKRFRWDRRATYVSMRHSVFAVNTVFIALELVMFFFSFPMGAPMWEKVSYAVIIVLMFIAICFLLYLMRLLNNYADLGGNEQDGRGLYHPSTEQELIELIELADRRGVKLRVRGAAHSLAHAIYAGPRNYPNKVSTQFPAVSDDINVLLDRYTGFRWLDDTLGIVEVDAGIHLGVDPNDPYRRSKTENSLLTLAAERGFTLADLGGITHQSISGFLSTGSAGGSLTYSVEDNIQAFSMIDGMGKVRWYWRGESAFHALLCSFGIQGVISKVQLRLTPMYIISGEEKTLAVTDSRVDFLDQDRPHALRQLLASHDYVRLLWWPQPGVERVVVWSANRRLLPPGFKPIPYYPISDKRWLSLLLQLAGGLVFTVLGEHHIFRFLRKVYRMQFAVGDALYELFGPSMVSWMLASSIVIPLAVLQLICIPVLLLLKGIRVNGGPLLASLLIKQMQPITKPGKVKYFEDYPYRSLPMDNEYNDALIKTEFTEFWIDMSDADRTLRFIRNLYKARGFSATGYYATEIYAARRSESWMSPAFGADVVRIDLFWFANNAGDPSMPGGFFNQFWDGMKAEGIPFRLHWGKFLPGTSIPASSPMSYRDWASYLKSQYPNWDEFMKLRKRRDPKELFLTEYWYQHLHG